MLTVPMPLLAVLCHWLLVPRFGMFGAAAATLIVAGIGAIAGVIAVNMRWNVWPNGMTLLRGGLVGLIVGIGANYYSAPGLWVLLKLGLGAILIAISLWLLGEISEEDRSKIRTYFNALK